LGKSFTSCSSLCTLAEYLRYVDIMYISDSEDDYQPSGSSSKKRKKVLKKKKQKQPALERPSRNASKNIKYSFDDEEGAAWHPDDDASQSSSDYVPSQSTQSSDADSGSEIELE